jgi:hypothetical protein
MKTSRQFLPSDRPRSSSGAKIYSQIPTALMAAHIQKNLASRDPTEMFKRHFMFDRNTEMIFKTAVSPATAATAGLSTTAIFPDEIAFFGGAAASGFLMDRGTRLKFDTSPVITLQNFTVNGSAAYFGEGVPIATPQLNTNNVALYTYKQIANINVFTRELFEHALTSVAPLVGEATTRDIGLAADGIMFGSAAPTAVTPGGLRWNLPALSASSASVKNDAMTADVSKLCAAVAGVAGNSDIVIIASPSQFASLKIWRADLAFTVFASSALANGVVMAIASNAFVSISGPPRFDVCSDALLVLDSAPEDITTASIAADQVASLIQRDLVAIRTIIPLNFGTRIDGAVAWITGTTW